MKIAIVGEHSRKGGGSYHQSLKTFEILSNIKEYEFKFLTVNSKIDDVEKKYINYNVNFIDQLFFLFYSSNIFKTLIKKFKIKNKFEKFLERNKIDLIIFLGCSRLSLFCNKINYVTYIYEFHHLFRPDLPEYKEWSDFDFREDLLINNVKKSLSLIVDTKKKSDDLIKYYNCDEKKINVIPLTPNISKTEKNSKKSGFKNIENFVNNKKKYFFYPAQYWSHKNHYYILLALKSLKEKYKKNIDFVFTGYKKNNFTYLKNKVTEFGLTEQVIFFEYLNDEEITFLYQNCEAVVMPSLVGYSSLPLYEAFYFEKPIFYSKNLLDKSLQKFVNEIDLDNPEDLSEKIIKFNENIDLLEEKVTLAKDFFNNHLSEEKIKFEYIKFFNKLNYLTKIYK